MKTAPVNYKLSHREPYDWEDKTQLTLYAFIFVTGTLGNGLVVKSFLQTPDQPGSRFVIALAVVDCISSVWIPSLSVLDIVYDHQHWPLGEAACMLLRPWATSLVYASAWLLVTISFERAR